MALTNDFKVKNGLTVIDSISAGGNLSASEGFFDSDVGIGTNNPSKKLEVNVGGTSSDGILVVGSLNPHIEANDSTNSVRTAIASEDSLGKIGTISSTDLKIVTGNTERIRIESGGNVGIGATNPVPKLHVYQNDAATSTTAGVTIEQDGTGDAQLQFLLSSAYRWVQGIDNSDSDKFKIGRGNGWSIGEDITITTSGNVGIGTTSPATKLHVGSGSGATVDTGYQIVADSGGIAGIQLLAGGTNQSSRVVFGDSADNDVGMVKYSHADNSMSFTLMGVETKECVSPLLATLV